MNHEEVIEELTNEIKLSVSGREQYEAEVKQQAAPLNNLDETLADSCSRRETIVMQAAGAAKEQEVEAARLDTARKK